MYIYALADPFDNLLERLSVAFMADCWAVLRGVLQRHHRPVDDLKWGWIHPGKSVCYADPQAAAVACSTPASLFGFVGEDPGVNHIARGLQDALRVSQPSFVFAATDLPSGFAVLGSNVADPVEGLSCFRDTALDEFTDWAPSDEVDAVWARACTLARQGSQSELDECLRQAKTLLGEPGFALLSDGLELARRNPI